MNNAIGIRIVSHNKVLPFKDAKHAFEVRYVEFLLRHCGGNVSLAARLAKKDRKDFYDVIRRTGADPGEFRDSAVSDELAAQLSALAKSIE
jgi:DNA-binding NtrC family response regulator